MALEITCSRTSAGRAQVWFDAERVLDARTVTAAEVNTTTASVHVGAFTLGTNVGGVDAYADNVLVEGLEAAP